MEKAQRYAQSALLAEPESYEAQKIIVACAAVNLPGFFANMKFKGELKKLVKLFLKQCAGGVTDSDFNYYLNQLLQVAEFGAQRGTGSLHFVYEAVISVPIDRIQKTNIKDTELVGQQRLIAEARLNT